MGIEGPMVGTEDSFAVSAAVHRLQGVMSTVALGEPKPRRTTGISYSGLRGEATVAVLGTESSRVSRRSKEAAAAAGQAPKRRTRVTKVDPSKTPFTPDMVQQGLSHLDRTSDGLRQAYLQLSLTGTDLSSVDAISGYTLLQTLKLQDNALTSLTGLSSLCSLTHLDVSRNKLTEVLAFRPSQAAGGSNLRHADFSHNAIMTVPDLSVFLRLETLVLDNNRLTSVGTGMQRLSLLKTLGLSCNGLASLAGLEGCKNLRHLDVRTNKLTSLAPLAGLTRLESLEAGANALHTLCGLDALTCLRRLDLSNNHIASLEEVARLRHAGVMSTLDLRGNPLERAHASRLHTVYLLPQLTQLNGAPTEAQEKVHSANMHGADAEELRKIRAKYFPRGELDDGGGALPPASAGLTPSRAEEEREGGDRDFVRVDAWARSAKLTAAVTAESVAGLAAHLASVCDTQLQLARVCYEWVVAHVAVPSDEQGTWSVFAPLFGSHHPLAAEAEAKLLGGMTGTWAERAAWLFTSLAKACRLEAITIPGYWKVDSRHRMMLPGLRVHTHNHTWSAVKVNGRWRLIDCVYAVLSRGHAPFYVPPEAFIYSCWPLEANWQLLDRPISLDAWWELPPCSITLFALGGSLPEAGSLGATNHVEAPQEGSYLPTVSFDLTLTERPGLSLAHTLLDASLRPVSSWPQSASGGLSGASAHDVGPGALTFQQAVAGPAGGRDVQFWSNVFGTRVHQIWTSLPGPGDWYVAVNSVQHVAGAMTLHIDGLDSPLDLRILDVNEILVVKFVVPPPDPAGPEAGVLAHYDTPVVPLPHTSAVNDALGAMLVSPKPDTVLEADQTHTFEVVAPKALAVRVIPGSSGSSSGSSGRGGGDTGGSASPEPPSPGSVNGRYYRVPVVSDGGASPSGDNGGYTDLEAVVDEGPDAQAQCTFRGRVILPRAGSVRVLAQMRTRDLLALSTSRPSSAPVQPPPTTAADATWVELLVCKVFHQVQHIIPLYHDTEPPEYDLDDPAVWSALELFQLMDANQDNAVTRGEMLVCLRKHPQHAHFLRVPTRVRHYDGSFDAFVSRFMEIDTSRLGTFGFDHFAQALGLVAGAGLAGGRSSRFGGTDSNLDGEGSVYSMYEPNASDFAN